MPCFNDWSNYKDYTTCTTTPSMQDIFLLVVLFSQGRIGRHHTGTPRSNSKKTVQFFTGKRFL